MLNLEIDGKPVQVPSGSTVMDETTCMVKALERLSYF